MRCESRRIGAWMYVVGFVEIVRLCCLEWRGEWGGNGLCHLDWSIHSQCQRVWSRELSA